MIKKALYLINQLYCRILDDEVPALGAQTTYYLILSFFPFLIFIITLASYTPLASAEVLSSWFSLLPDSSYLIVAEIVGETIQASSRTLLSLGMLATIWTSSSGLMAIIRGINKAYDIEENRPFWKVRALSIVYTLILALLIMLTFVLVIFGEMLGKWLFSFAHLPQSFVLFWSVGKVLIAIGMMLLVLVLLYVQAPNYKVRLRDALPGAIFASLGWISASLLFSYYVNQFSNYSRTYGSIGGVIVLLIWLYISSIMIIVGGEVNATLQFWRENRKKAECKKYGFRLPLFRVDDRQ